MNPRDNPVYRLDDLEIDAQSACVRRGSKELHMRRQAFQVLLYLVEKRQRFVSKAELHETLWRDTAVTDNALVQCIAEIRRVLGDDTHKPRFIRTIPKAGYRFVAPVERLQEDEPPAVHWKDGPHPPQPAPGNDAALSPTSVTAAPLSMRRPASRRGAALFLLAAVLILLSAAAAWMIFQWTAATRVPVTLSPSPGKKTLAVMFFENRSGTSDMDWLREGLPDMIITDLARSNRLVVLSRQQLHLIFDRTGRQSTAPLRLDSALEIARKSRAEAVLLGSYATVGDQVRVDVQLHDVHSGQLLTAEHLIVNSPKEILSQVDLLAIKLESQLAAVPPESGAAGLSEVMTGNLEAYRFYSLGLEKANAFENAEAIGLLKRAIQLDPKFAMAYARIGYAYAVTDFLPEMGKPFLEKAFELSNRLTEKDRLYIAAWYAIARGDYPDAVRTFRRMIVLYPLETEAYWRLGRLLHGEQRTEEGLAVLRQGLVIDPEAKDLYNGLGVVLLGLYRYPEAIEAEKHFVELAPMEANSHDSLGMSYQQAGYHDMAVAEYLKALELNRRFEPSLIHLGDAYFQQGQYRAAIQQYQQYIQVTQSRLARALGYSNIAYVYRHKGDLHRAAQAAENEIRLEGGAVWNSLVLAYDRHDRDSAARLRQKLFARLPYPQRGARRDLRSQDYYRGYLELLDGRDDHAIDDFKQALKSVPPTSGIDLHEDCLANAYLKLGRWNEAIDEYRRILGFNPNYPLAEFHLGQALEGRGDKEQARAAYEKFLQTWRNADADVPEVIEAKRRLTGLPNASRRPAVTTRIQRKTE